MSSITKDLRKKSDEELAQIVVKLKAQLLEIRFSVANGEQEKLHTIVEIKKTIARVFTILNERNTIVSVNKMTKQKKSKAVYDTKKDKVAVEAIHEHETQNLIQQVEESQDNTEEGAN